MDYMDQIDGALGTLATGLQQSPVTKASVLSALLRGQQSPSFSMMSGGQPPAPMQPMQQQPMQQPPQAVQRPPYDPQRPLRQAVAQAARQQPQQPMQQPQQAPTQDLLGADYQRLMSERQRAVEQEQQAMQPPDMTRMNEIARQRADSGDQAMLRALAAQQAGPGFQAIQQHSLRQAEEAHAPMRMTGGTLTDQGWVEDAAHTYEMAIKRADAKVRSIDMALQHNLAAQQRQELQTERLQAAREAQEARIEGQKFVAALVHGGGAGGVGTWGDAGTDPATGQPVYRNNKTNQLMISDASGQPVPYRGTPTAKGSTTEDERKSAAQMSQAAGAMANRDAVLAAHPSAAKPGIAETIAGWLPGQWGSDIQNATRSGNRQLFTQAASSFGEAALRMATGAGMGEHEARQKIAELSPQFGDKQPVIEQKLRAWDQYMTQFKQRAGRAAGPAGAPQASAPEGRVRITSDAEWEKLAPGTKFIGPDGIGRTK